MPTVKKEEKKVAKLSKKPSSGFPLLTKKLSQAMIRKKITMSNLAKLTKIKNEELAKMFKEDFKSASFKDLVSIHKALGYVSFRFEF